MFRRPEPTERDLDIQFTGGYPTRGGRPPMGVHLAVGIDNYNTQAYGFTIRPLKGCKNDAQDMQAISQSQGFTSRILLDDQATADAIMGKIRAAAAMLMSGDIFWLSISSHGTQYPRPDDVGPGPAAVGEALVTYDRLLFDKLLWNEWFNFQPGVRVVVTSDCCFSLGAVRAFPSLLEVQSRAERAIQASQHPDQKVPLSDLLEALPGREAVELALALVNGTGRALEGVGYRVAPQVAGTLVQEVLSPLLQEPAVPEARALEPELAARDVRQRRTLYEPFYNVARSTIGDPQCILQQCSAGAADQTVSDGFPDATGRQNGAYTRLFKQEWRNAVSYKDLQKRIRDQLPPSQTPDQFWPVRYAGPEMAFDLQRPFTI